MQNKEYNQYKIFGITGDFYFFIKIFVYFSAVSMYFTLPVPIDGEEGTYTISAMEMFLHGHFLDSTLYGAFYGRPPLLSWLIIGVAKIIGWDHIVIASRFVNASAVILTSIVLFQLVRFMSKSRNFAWLSVSAFFIEMVLMRLGWLSYADCTMSLFVLLSIASLWVAVEKQNNLYLIIAMISLFLGFLTKAFTPYMFYGIVGLVLLWKHKNRLFLIKPSSWLIHCLAVILPFIYIWFANPLYLQHMYNDFFAPGGDSLFASWNTVPRYIFQILIFQPLQLILTTSPFSIIVIYCLLRKKEIISDDYKSIANIGFWVFTISFIPCWFAWNHWPEGRYYLPVIPILAIWFAYYIYNGSYKQYLRQLGTFFQCMNPA